MHDMCALFASDENKMPCYFSFCIHLEYDFSW